MWMAIAESLTIVAYIYKMFLEIAIARLGLAAAL